MQAVQPKTRNKTLSSAEAQFCPPLGRYTKKFECAIEQGNVDIGSREDSKNESTLLRIRPRESVSSNMG